jgi:hypothetical protein
MRLLKLIAAAVVLSVGGGWSMINAAEQQLNPKAISITSPDQFQWKRNGPTGRKPAARQAAINRSALGQP